MKSTTLPLSLLVPDPDQARKTIPTAELNQLVESIRTRGLLLPLRVKPADAAGTHVIVSGHRRFAALQKLGVTEVPCIVVEGPIDDTTILAEQLAENLVVSQFASRCP